MVKRLLWQRTGGYWLFWASVLYLTAGIVDVFVLTDDYTLLLQFAWLTALALPLVYRPLAHWLNMRTVWE